MQCSTHLESIKLARQPIHRLSYMKLLSTKKMFIQDSELVSGRKILAVQYIAVNII